MNNYSYHRQRYHILLLPDQQEHKHLPLVCSGITDGSGFHGFCRFTIHSQCKKVAISPVDSIPDIFLSGIIIDGTGIHSVLLLQVGNYGRIEGVGELFSVILRGAIKAVNLNHKSAGYKVIIEGMSVIHEMQNQVSDPAAYTACHRIRAWVQIPRSYQDNDARFSPLLRRC